MSIVIGEDKIPFIDLGDGFIIRLEYEDLSDEKYIEKAKTELRETPEVVQAAISELRLLIKGKKFLGSFFHSYQIKAAVGSCFQIISIGSFERALIRELGHSTHDLKWNNKSSNLNLKCTWLVSAIS